MCSLCRPLAEQETALQALANALGAEAPPAELLQGLLSDALSRQELCRSAACAGNQLAACTVDSVDGPQVRAGPRALDHRKKG